jgi:hypothetical protein
LKPKRKKVKICGFIPYPTKSGKFFTELINLRRVYLRLEGRWNWHGS